MNTSFAQHRNPWKFRLRLLTLIAFLTLGMATAGIERWRQTDFDQVWGKVHDKLSFFLNPISERTYRIFGVAFKVDRLLKVEDENKRLLRENSKLNIQNQRLSEELSRLNRLAGLGRWSGPSDLVFLSADVSGLIASGQSAALIINKGREDGVRPRDPVVALGGLVGIVQSVSAHTSRVQAITDSASAVGVMDRASRARGVIFRGDRKEEPLKFMPENEVQPINIGGVLITSGFENSVYPKGIIVGTIQDRKLNTYGIPYGIVKPAVSFESLEEVLLVIRRSRLTGLEAPNSTETLGSRRIFMPDSLMLVEPPENVTTASLAPLPPESLDGSTTATIRPPEIDAATSATLPAELDDDIMDDMDATTDSETVAGPVGAPPTPPEKMVNVPLPLEQIDPAAAKRLKAQGKGTGPSNTSPKKSPEKAVEKAPARAEATRREPPSGHSRQASGDIGPGDLGL